MVKGLEIFSFRLVPWYIFLIFSPFSLSIISILAILFSHIKWGNCYNGHTVLIVELVMAI